MQERAVIHPQDGDDQKAERIADELRRQRLENTGPKPAIGGVLRQPEFQNHDGDDDGDHAVAEGFDATGAWFS